MNSECYTETLQSMNARLSRILPTSNNPRKRKAAHNSAPHSGHQKFWMDSVAESIPQSWPCAIRLSHLWSLKKSLLNTITPMTPAACRSPVAAEEEQFLPGGNTCSCLETEDCQQNMETTPKNNCDFHQCCGEVLSNLWTEWNKKRGGITFGLSLIRGPTVK